MFDTLKGLFWLGHTDPNAVDTGDVLYIAVGNKAAHLVVATGSPALDVIAASSLLVVIFGGLILCSRYGRPPKIRAVTKKAPPGPSRAGQSTSEAEPKNPEEKGTCFVGAAGP